MTAAATPSADVIVAGAGHSSLITAAYLTRAVTFAAHYAATEPPRDSKRLASR